jgi:dephospho-CoA kinase
MPPVCERLRPTDPNGVSSSILRVGLTGNIAAGKSTVARWMVDFGCHVLDADELGHQCLEPGEPTYDRVVETFGATVLGDDGAVNRVALGDRVFGDDAARKRLEEILHPAIRDKEQHHADQIERAAAPAIVVTEATLLYETGSAGRYQRMVVVTAPIDIRLDRLKERGLSADEAGQRMAAQMEQAEKAERADYVIDNGSTLEAGREATRIVCEQLQLDLMRWMGGSPLGPTG